jgi:dTDP-glucose 4,6-dehydratase
MTKIRILITGGCGFIPSHVVEHFHRTTEWDIFIIDKLSYAAKGTSRLRSADLLNSPRIHLYVFDLQCPLSPGLTEELGSIDYIVHMAAETHVDNSISDPVDFINNNVDSTLNLLEYSRNLTSLKKFFYFSTDEVYGPAPEGTDYKEWDRHNPTNPYSASKSAAEQICMAYKNTYKVPIIIINVMNAFGERQHVEKFIPKCIKLIHENKLVTIHSNSTCTQAGSRFYIHARNIASAVAFLIKKGEVGEKYNVTGEKEMDNLSLAQFIAKHLGKELKYEMVDFHSTRPGHDLRYSLDGSKLFNLGWHLPKNFEESLIKTIDWTLDHPEWLKE